MRLVFASGDIGGARALAPVAKLAVTSGNQVWFVRHGAIVKEYLNRDVTWNWVYPHKNQQELLSDLDPDIIVFASSVSDQFALDLALTAQSKGIKTVHILDNWSNYSARMINKAGKRLTPDIYTVMDDLAASAAELEGINPSSIVVTGTPALSNIKERTPAPKGDIIFISEPVSLDQGRDRTQPIFRGYTEDEVLKLVFKTLQRMPDHVNLKIFPHPREKLGSLEHTVKSICTTVRSTIVTENEKLSVLSNSRAVIGMSSILLYECWLSGLPVLSIQPNLVLQNLRYLEGRPGLHIAYDTNRAVLSLNKLLGPPVASHKARALVERVRHQRASTNILGALSEIFAN